MADTKINNVADVNKTVDLETKPLKSTVDKPLKTVKKSKPKLNLTDSILVKNGFYGRLIVHLPKAGYDIIFDNFKDEDYIELAELKTLRNSSPKLFKSGWLIIDDPDVIEFLTLEGLYKNTLSLDEMCNIFMLSSEELVEKILNMSDGQKKSVTYKALELIETGEIDSRKIIESLEQALNTQLVEK